MIKLENVVLASPEQMEFIIQGMRNTYNSHDRSAGTDHRKFMRMMPVYVRITAPLYW